MSRRTLPRSSEALALAVLALSVAVGIGVLRRGVPHSEIDWHPTGHRVDVNHDDAATLQLLPGIGAVVAENVVDYRENHGPFERAAELERVRLIGPTIRRRIGPYITVGALEVASRGGGEGSR